MLGEKMRQSMSKTVPCDLVSMPNEYNSHASPVGALRTARAIFHDIVGTIQALLQLFVFFCALSDASWLTRNNSEKVQKPRNLVFGDHSFEMDRAMVFPADRDLHLIQFLTQVSSLATSRTVGFLRR